MAIDKAVDSSALNSNLTAVANAIRTKGGTSAQLAFPAGFVSAIGNIPTGTPVRTYSGSFTTDANGEATINCGFKPDLVYIEGYDIPESRYFFTIPLFLHSGAAGEYIVGTGVLTDNDNQYAEVGSAPRTNGFFIGLYRIGWNWNYLHLANYTMNYTAIKWTA